MTSTVVIGIVLGFALPWVLYACNDLSNIAKELKRFNDREEER